MVRWSLPFVSLLLFLGGCYSVTQELRATYSNEFGCDQGRVAINDLGMQRYRVSGCNQSVVYQCVGRTCIPSEREETASAPSEEVYQPRPLTETGPQPKAVEVTKRGEGKGVVVSADVTLGDRGLLKLRAAPSRENQRVQMKLAVLEAAPDLSDCELELMVNGQRLQVGKSHFSRKNTLSTLLVEVSRDVVTELGVARQLAVRACERRWSLSEQALTEVRSFVERYDEELAWNGEKKASPNGGMLAPSGGWPAWAPSTQPPPAKQQAALDGHALFELLSPSVFMIESIVSDGSRLGSAVAVSKTELVTNCHVLDGSRKVIVKQKGREWVGQILRADPAQDRCVLGVPDQVFVPVRGVRSYADLKVGENLFTLGSPNGLELSIASGILSGVREEEGRRFVQTTAPISPGSSGGGLFDAYGNLVGVTTLVLAGKERLNQSLNFAVPADAFFQP